MHTACGRPFRVAVAIVTMITFGAQPPVYAGSHQEVKGKAESLKMPFSAPPQYQKYLETRDSIQIVLEDEKTPGRDLKDKVKDAVVKTVGKIVEKVLGDKNDSGKKRDKDNRGDPKTDYDQSENRYHSEKQRDRDSHDSEHDDDDPVVVDPPVVPDPPVVDPVVPDPIIVDPVVPDPIVVDPVVPDPIVVDPVVPDPIVVDPVVPDPIVVDPVVPDPIVVDPVVPDPIVVDPVVPDPIVVDPVVPDPIVVDPVVPDPIVVDPVVPDPVAVDPKVDLATWDVVSTFTMPDGSSIGIYTPPVGTSDYVYARVVFDPVTNEPVSATALKLTTHTDMPDLTNTELLVTSLQADGSRIETYVSPDYSRTYTLYYDSLGSLLYSELQEELTLSLDQILLG